MGGILYQTILLGCLMGAFVLGTALAPKSTRFPYNWGQFYGMVWLLIGVAGMVTWISAPLVLPEMPFRNTLVHFTLFCAYSGILPGILTLRYSQAGWLTGTLLAWYFFPFNLLLIPFNAVYCWKRRHQLEGRHAWWIATGYILPAIIVLGLIMRTNARADSAAAQPAPFALELPAAWQSKPPGERFAFTQLYTWEDRAWLGVIVETNVMTRDIAQQLVIANLKKVSSCEPRVEVSPPELIGGLTWDRLRVDTRLSHYDLSYLGYVHTGNRGTVQLTTWAPTPQFDRLTNTFHSIFQTFRLQPNTRNSHE